MFSNPASNLEALGIVDGMKIADFGAGSGFYTITAAKKVGVGGRVYAIEVVKEFVDKIIRQAQTEGLRNIEVIWGNIEKIGGSKLRDESVDRAIASNVLFQIEAEHRDNFSLEIKRVLKKGGKLLLIDWSDQSPIGPNALVKPSDAENIFTKIGFVTEKNFNAGDHHYGIVFKKQ